MNDSRVLDQIMTIYKRVPILQSFDVPIEKFYKYRYYAIIIDLIITLRMNCNAIKRRNNLLWYEWVYLNY